MHPAVQFFQFPQEIAHKQYEALRAFYLEGKSAAEVAQQERLYYFSFLLSHQRFQSTVKATKSFSTIFPHHDSGSQASRVES